MKLELITLVAFGVALGVALPRESAAAAPPLVAQVGNCAPDGTAAPSPPGGWGTVASARFITLNFAWALPDAMTSAADAVASTKRVEVCFFDDSFTGTCPFTNNSMNTDWRVYEAGGDAPAPIKPFGAPGAQSSTKVPLDWALAANPNTYLFLLVTADGDNSGLTTTKMNAAIASGGFCRLPEHLDDRANAAGKVMFTAFGQPPAAGQASDPDNPEMGIDACLSGNTTGFFAQNACIDPSVAAFGLDILAGNELWQADVALADVSALNPPVWANGMCGLDPCPTFVLYYAGLNHHAYDGRVLLSFTDNHPAGTLDRLTSGAGWNMAVVDHEYSHRLQGVWLKQMGGPQTSKFPFHEGINNAIGPFVCLFDYDPSLPADVCTSPIRLGTNDVWYFNSYLNEPGISPFDPAYISGVFWRYTIEQFAEPMAQPGSATKRVHPGGIDSAFPAIPGVALGRPERRSDEGLDLVGEYLQQFQLAPQDTVLDAADTTLQLFVGRTLEQMIHDMHTALLLKDYKPASVAGPERFRLNWVGMTNVFDPGDPLLADQNTFGPWYPNGAATTPPSRPFKVMSDFGQMPDGLKRAHRRLDSRTPGMMMGSEADWITLAKNQVVGSAQAEAISEYGAMYLSVHPAADYDVPLRVRVTPEPGTAKPLVRIFKVEAGVPALIEACKKDEDGALGKFTEHCEYTFTPDLGEEIDVSFTPPTGSTDEVLVVVSAGHEPASFTWSFGQVDQPRVVALDPLSTRVADAGDAVHPRPVLLQFTTVDGNNQPLSASLDSLKVTLGGCKTAPCELTPCNGEGCGANTFEVHSFAVGVHWALIQLPANFYPNNPSGWLDLEIELDQFQPAQEPKAIKYGPPASVAMELVLDASGSMNDYDKLDALKIAGELLIRGLADTDAIGMVAFNQDARLAFGILPLSTSGVRNAAITSLNNLTAEGCTSLGDGVLEGQSWLATAFDDINAMPPGFANPPDKHAMVVLSDGLNNAPWAPFQYYTTQFDLLLSDGLPNDCGAEDMFDNQPWFDAGKLRYPARKSAGRTVPAVSGVAIGQDADKTELMNLTSPDGVFTYLAGPQDASMVQKHTATLDFSDAFRQAADASSGHERIETFRALSVAPVDMPAFHVERGATELLVSVSSATQRTNLLILISPLGQTVIPVQSSDDTAVFRVADPPGGTWTWSTIRPVSSDPGDGAKVFIEEAVRSSLVLFAAADVAWFVSPEESGSTESRRFTGADVPLRAVVVEGRALRGTNVTSVSAEVHRPDGGTSIVALHDDGLHQDGVAGDGLYGAIFDQTALEGIYTARIVAEGSSPVTGDSFRREKNIAFELHDGPDHDRDGLPTWWELANGTDPRADDGRDDPDGDGLSNLDEFYHHTSPLRADTDGGGENDGSEVASGGDPRNPGDDGVRRVVALVVPGNGKVMIDPQLDRNSGDVLEVQHASSARGNYERTVPDEGPLGMLSDPAENKRPACYRMRRTHDEVLGTRVISHVSDWSPPICVTPAEDPYPPQITEASAEWTERGVVRLVVHAEERPIALHAQPQWIDAEAKAGGPVEMLVSERGDFADARWERYQAERRLELYDDAELLYLRLRDDAGNESAAVVVPIR